MEIGHISGGHAVEAAGEGRLRGGEDAGHDQARHAGGQFPDDEERKDAVRPRHQGVELAGMQPVKGEEGGPDREEEELGDGRDHGVGPDRARSAFAVRSGEIALDDILARGVGEEVGEDGADHDDPAAGDEEVEIPAHILQEAPGVVGQPDDRPRAALHAQDDGHQGPDRAPHEHDRLRDVGPDHGADAALHGVDHAQDSHEQNGAGHADAADRRQGQGGQVEHDGHAPALEENEKGAGDHARGEVEAPLQVFVGGGDVEVAIKGQIDQGHQGRQQQVAVGEDEVPADTVGLGGDGHEGDRAEHGRKDAQSGGPPRYALAAAEKVIGGLVALAEAGTQPDHRRQVEDEGGVVDPAEGRLAGGELEHTHSGGAHTGTDLAADQKVPALPVDDRNRDLREGFSRAPGRPGVGDGVVDQHGGVEAGVAGGHAVLRAVIGADEQEMGLGQRRHRRRRGCGRKGQVGDSFPLLPFGIPGVAVGQVGPLARRLAIAAVFQCDAANEIELAGLNACRGEGARRAGPGGQRDPLRLHGRQVEAPEAAAGGGRAGSAFSAGYIDRRTDERAAAIGHRFRQGRQGLGLQIPLRAPAEDENISKMAGGVTAAGAEHAAARHCQADAVAARRGQAAGRLPVSIWLIQNPDAVVPPFRASLPGQSIRKIGSAGSQQGIAAEPGVHPRKAMGVRQGRKAAPLPGVRWSLGAGRMGVPAGRHCRSGHQHHAGEPSQDRSRSHLLDFLCSQYSDQNKLDGYKPSSARTNA